MSSWWAGHRPPGRPRCRRRGRGCHATGVPAGTRHAASDVWLTTRSIISLMPRACMRRQHGVEVGHAAELRLDGAVVADVVAVVVIRRRIHRRQPHHVHPQGLQVVEPGGDAGDVAHAVTVAVLEAARVDLVDNAVLPPGCSGGGHGGAGLVWQCGGGVVLRRWCVAAALILANPFDSAASIPRMQMRLSMLNQLARASRPA